MEGAGFKNTVKVFFEGTETMGNKFVEPGLKKASPLTPAGVLAKTKTPQVGEITSNILKSLSDGKILSLTDMHGHELRLKKCNSIQIKFGREMDE